MVSYGLVGGRGIQAAITGAFDLSIGIIYLVGLPRHLDVTLRDLLLDSHFEYFGRSNLVVAVRYADELVK